LNYKIGFISLGCPKNEVDAERMLSKLIESGCEIVDVPYEADIIIINTCAFIEDAKKEAIDNILEAASYKEDGNVKKILVTGCLSERYKEELLKEMPEVDGAIGIGADADICEAVEKLMSSDEKVSSFPPKHNMPLEGDRTLTSPAYWAYLKIADGCSSGCTYCAIPAIRGPFRSRSMENIVEEARKLADNGAKEIILIAQDTTRYGLDLYGKLCLPDLLKKLEKIDNIRWIRLLYCYPDKITDDLLDTMASSDKILNYIDLPLQHSEPSVLKAMKRPGDGADYIELIKKIRAKLPDAVIRTTLITGFPGETEENFKNLQKFVSDAQFDRLGCFAYSKEEGTPAAEMDNQIDEDVKKERGDLIMEQQYGIFSKKQENLIGKTYESIVEGYDGYSDCYIGRTWMDAPEIDSQVYFTSDKKLNDGDIVNVEITDTKDGIDLIGREVE